MYILNVYNTVQITLNKGYGLSGSVWNGRGVWRDIVATDAVG